MRNSLDNPRYEHGTSRRSAPDSPLTKRQTVAVLCLLIVVGMCAVAVILTIRGEADDLLNLIT